MDNLDGRVADVFRELKDFQAKTVEFAYQRLNENGRYLVADEVGLGKTKIAKGVIAKALKEYVSSGRTTPYRVFYICSNQALANQNLKDLNIFKDDTFIDRDLNRLIYLAKQRKTNQGFLLSSLTPSTSFNITVGTGHQDERKLIYTVLASHSLSEVHLKGLKWLMIGQVSDWDSWQRRLDWYYKYYKNDIVEGIADKFIQELKQTKLSKDLDDCVNEVRAYYAQPTNVYELLIAYTHALKRKQSLKRVKEDFKHRNRILEYLRKGLINVSLNSLDADLFILDEFQRFNELVGVGNNRESEASRLAKKIFSIEGAKSLLLSATPFRLYTTKFEELEDENHYSELNQLLQFLYNDKGDLESLDKTRKSFFTLLQNADTSESAIAVKERLEGMYKAVMCRTEKLLVTDNKNSMTLSKDKADLITTKIDLENFIHTDQILQSIIRQFNQKLSYSIDYNKSVPFPLSFMDGYKSKKKLSEVLEQNPIEVGKLIRKNRKAWVNINQIQNYSLNEFPNARFRQLLEETVNANEMWKLLWLPPSLTYYPGQGVYKDKENLSKTLIFSKWVMVPKMIAGLLSYEVERKSIANSQYFPDLKATYTPPKLSKPDKNGKEKRKPRKPNPILRLQNKADKPNSLRSFTLLYPSKTLSDLCKFASNVHRGASYKELRRGGIERIEEMLEPLKQYQIQQTSSDKNWYWAAPLLLDKYYNSNIYDSWIANLRNHAIASRTIKKDDSTKENKSAASHLEVLIQLYENPEMGFELGNMPDDLAKVLFDIANGSPANCILESYSSFYNWRSQSSEILNHALGLAYDFMLFFDKPESIAAVQINEMEKDARLKENRDNNDIHWNLVLRYCIDGNLQAVLDEYCHMLRPKCSGITELTDALAKGLNIRTSIVKVEGIGDYNSSKFTEKNLRCHYAVNFGSQNLETEEGVSRAGDVIDNFNSPFRPFVLASTSLGQEGLDFHYYCRKIMHWNLPRNPVEFEQREGRINRYKGMVIRQNIAKKYKHELKSNDVWNELFEIAETKECKITGKPEIIPYWYTEVDEDLKIERNVPLLPFSKDVMIYEELISILALYRLTFGQPRQEELLHAIQNNNATKKDVKDLYDKLLIRLSPYYFK